MKKSLLFLLKRLIEALIIFFFLHVLSELILWIFYGYPFYWNGSVLLVVLISTRYGLKKLMI